MKQYIQKKPLKALIENLCCKSKPAVMKIAVLTKEAHEFNGFYTKLLVINREDFKIEKRGLRHTSGTFFKLDRSNFKIAKQFLNKK
jgi:hypothetical protein